MWSVGGVGVPLHQIKKIIYMVWPEFGLGHLNNYCIIDKKQNEYCAPQ